MHLCACSRRCCAGSLKWNSLKFFVRSCSPVTGPSILSYFRNPAFVLILIFLPPYSASGISRPGSCPYGSCILCRNQLLTGRSIPSRRCRKLCANHLPPADMIRDRQISPLLLLSLRQTPERLPASRFQDQPPVLRSSRSASGSPYNLSV